LVFFPVEEEERLVLSVVNLRNRYRTAESGSVVVIVEGRPRRTDPIGKEVIGVQRAVPEVLKECAVEFVRSGLAGYVDDPTAGMSEFRASVMRDDAKLLGRVDRK